LIEFAYYDLRSARTSIKDEFVTEPENLVLVLLREMRAEMKAEFASVRSEMATKTELSESKTGLAELRSEMRSGFANVASDLLDLEKRLNDQTKVLRRSVFELHSTIIGHGNLYAELEERIRRLEERMDGAARAR
jgi:phosphoenolpyruvate-protein kinase (PTS system EI component)